MEFRKPTASRQNKRASSLDESNSLRVRLRDGEVWHRSGGLLKLTTGRLSVVVTWTLSVVVTWTLSVVVTYTL